MKHPDYIGHYEIIRFLADGGMAKVYLALDQNGAKVVLKVPHSAYAADREFVRRLRSEKDALCRLNHPCITIFKDFHEDWDPPVLVMEYVEGVTLGELLKNEPGPWEVKRSFHILLQMAEALAYCHKAGIIHRDAKPANILITGADHVKVTDFGIARLKDAPSLTQVGVVVGSALVMAPEQWLRRPLDLKVDIYALGVIAYRMLTGRYPFEGSVEELRAGHCEEHAVPPRSLNPDLPPPVSNLIMECLNKDPRLRISSCDEFIRRIRALQPALVIYERYRFEDEIGRGAMGIVYRATRRDDGMTVAIKTLDQRLTDPALLKRLKSEASVLARLNHAFICRLIEAQESFLVMQFVRGGTLGDRIRSKNGLPIPEALHYFKEILQALAAAHQENVIHRDLKPSNVMITDDPIESHAIVMDFGIAKLLGSSGLTATMEGLGAVPYKAPELWQKRPPDQRSDIYALGIMLYEMLTNALPFDGPDALDFERQHLKEQAPLLPETVQGDRAAIDHVIRRCLEKDRTKRYDSVDELYEDLKVAGRGAETAHTDVIPQKPAQEQKPSSKMSPATDPVVKLPDITVSTPMTPAPLPPSAPPQKPTPDPKPQPKQPRKPKLPPPAKPKRPPQGTMQTRPEIPLPPGPPQGKKTQAEDGGEGVTISPALKRAGIAVVALAALVLVLRFTVFGTFEPLPESLHLEATRQLAVDRDGTATFTVTAEAPSQDSLVNLDIEPVDGITIRRLSSDQFEVDFTPFPGCPSRHTITLYAEGNITGESATRDVTIDITEQMQPPRIVVDPVIVISGDRDTTFPVTIIPNGPGDTIRSFGASPREGLTWTALDDNRYEVTYTPFGHPEPYVVTFTAEGTGGTATAEVRLRSAREPIVEAGEVPSGASSSSSSGLSIRLTITPPSYILLDGRQSGESPVSDFKVNIDREIQTVTLMNPNFPLYEITVPVGATELIETVNLSEKFTSTDTAWVNIDIIGPTGMRRAVRANPIRINMGEFRDLIATKPVGRPGTYRIELPRALGVVVDKVEFNNTVLPGNAVDFSLEAATTGFLYNRLIFYVHSR